MCVQGSAEEGEYSEFPETGRTGSCKLPNNRTGNQTLVLCKSTKQLNYRTIFSAPGKCHL